MSKFKVGDKVRVIEEQIDSGLHHGTTHTVSKNIRGGISLGDLIQIEGNSTTYFESRFELVKEDKMKFKVRDKVRCIRAYRYEFTKGKIYEITHLMPGIVGVIDNLGASNGISSDYFELVEEYKPTLVELVKAANEAELAIKRLVEHPEFSTKVKVNDIENYYDHRYTHCQYELKKEIAQFTVNEGWLVSLKDDKLHIGCKNFLVPEFLLVVNEIVNGSAARGSFGQGDVDLECVRNGIRFKFYKDTSYIMSYATAERILKELKDYNA